MTPILSGPMPSAPVLGIDPLSDAGESALTIECSPDISTLYSTYRPLVFRMALHMLADVNDADDAVQDIFLKLYCHPTLYDPRRGQFAHWIARVTHNYCLDMLRRKATHVHHSGPEHNFSEVADTDLLSVEEDVWRTQRARALRGALTHVNVTHVHLLHLAYVRGLSHSQIARATGVPLGTVKTRLRGTCQNLRVLLAQDAVFAESFARIAARVAPPDA